MRDSKPTVVFGFLGLILVAVAVIGFLSLQNPDLLQTRDVRSFSAAQLCQWCAEIWLPAGVIGAPMLIIATIVSLVREHRSKE